MTVKNYRELIVWQKAMDLTEQIYQVTKNFPREEIYGLTSQILRAAVSVPSNIAEGQARSSTAEFKNFLSIARGSLAEVETQVLIAHRLNYINQDQVAWIMETHCQISKMLPALMSKPATSH
ncbi:MAG: four helix bundle protein [Victivallales bacterium]|nr:four helix bundle protein [Victivallales bacterium]